MGRTYSDQSFATRHIVQGLAAGNAMNGSRSAAATLETLLVSVPFPCEVTSFKIYNSTLGTSIDAVTKLVLNKSLAGTGAAEALGTVSIGTLTLAANKSTAGSAAGTLAAGDKLYVTISAGTETAANPRLVSVVEVVEKFEND